MLDTATLLTMTSIVSVFVAAFFWIVWRDGQQYPGMMTIKVGTSIFAIASALSVVRNSSFATDSLCIGFANVGSMIGSSLALNGSLQLAKKHSVWRWHISIITIILPPFLYFLFVDPSTPLRAAFSATWGFLMTLTTLVALLSPPSNTQGQPAVHAFAVLLSIECFFEFSRGVLTPVIDPNIDYLHPSIILTAFYLEVIFFVIGYLVLMLQLVNSRLRCDLLRSEAWTTSAIQVANDAFALFDRQHRLVVSNGCCQDYFPAIADHLRERSSFDTLFSADPSAFGLEQRWVDSYLRSECDFDDFDRIAHLPNGFWLRVTGKSLPDGGLVLCWSDITVFKRAEDLLVSELERQREFAAMQRNFVSMASHQIRAPLATIDWNVQLLAPIGSIARSQGETIDRITQIRRTVGRLIDLLETMLGAASMEAGKLQLKRAPVNIDILLREVVARAGELAPGRVINIRTGTLPKAMLCDSTLLAQVFSNLLSNALKYSASSTQVNITAKVEQNDVTIDVEDFGIGIPEAAQEKIFDQFFRADNAMSFAGSGIGLTVARVIIELHGGRIVAVSQLGVGSTFTVYLPIQQGSHLEV